MMRFVLHAAGFLGVLALSGCASTRVELGSVRGDETLPRAGVIYVREFEEGTDWAFQAGDAVTRDFIAQHLAELTARMRERLGEIAATQVLLNAIPKEGLLVTGQILRVRAGPSPQVHCRILIFDLARSYHYPVTVFEMQTPPGQAALFGGGSLEKFWDTVAQRSRDFVRSHSR